ncbi:transcriptional and immune response regulator a [Erpetoichthys calabaricus]|uniref:transcriptional and immune response regulator a n=1 Tax=Erpetoichthys calabaricus TaxID=27687 RepID=UPI00109FA63F|nr:transcriptional and immune response regulator a [Erpetoichthys calabaricus]
MICKFELQNRVKIGSMSSESPVLRRVSPSIHGNRFDTAHRKKALPHIFENVSQDAVQRLFQRAGDHREAERAHIVMRIDQDPEEMAKALIALKQKKKDKFLQILGLARFLLKL